MNARQMLVMNQVLDGIDGMEGKPTNANWAVIGKCYGRHGAARNHLPDGT